MPIAGYDRMRTISVLMMEDKNIVYFEDRQSFNIEFPSLVVSVRIVKTFKVFGTTQLRIDTMSTDSKAELTTQQIRNLFLKSQNR